MERLTGNDNKFFQDGMDEYKVSAVYFKLKAYEDAEEQELLVRLPCRAGNMLWTFYNWPGKKVYSAKVLSVSTLDTKTTIHTDRLGIFPSQDIGKTVFLTREEAEKALEGANR